MKLKLNLNNIIYFIILLFIIILIVAKSISIHYKFKETFDNNNLNSTNNTENNLDTDE